MIHRSVLKGAAQTKTNTCHSFTLSFIALLESAAEKTTNKFGPNSFTNKNTSIGTSNHRSDFQENTQSLSTLWIKSSANCH